jgi:uncharacterized protein involved in exopolysaccharide biosynthesis
MLSAMITAGFISNLLTPVYEAKAVFFVPATPDVASYLSPTTDVATKRRVIIPMTDDEPHAPYIGLLKSKSMRELVYELFPHKTMNDLRRDIDFSLSDEYLLSVYARDRDPVKASQIANAYAENLNYLLGSYSLSRSERNQGIIEEEISVLRHKFDEARHALKEFQKTKGVIAPDVHESQLISQKTDFQSKLNDALIEQKKNESKITSLKKQLEKEAKIYVSSELIIGSPLMGSLRQELSDVELKMTRLKVDYKENHPDFVVLKNQYNQIKKHINTEIERLAKSQIKGPDTSYEVMRRNLVNLLVEKESIMASLHAYKTVLRIIEEKIQEVPDIVSRMQSHKREITNNGTMLRTLEMKLQEVAMQSRRDLQAVIVVDKAIPPVHPIFPGTILNVMVAGITGLIGGIFYCFFVSYLEETKEQRLYKILKAIESRDN